MKKIVSFMLLIVFSFTLTFTASADNISDISEKIEFEMAVPSVKGLAIDKYDVNDNDWVVMMFKEDNNMNYCRVYDETMSLQYGFIFCGDSDFTIELDNENITWLYINNAYSITVDGDGLIAKESILSSSYYTVKSEETAQKSSKLYEYSLRNDESIEVLNGDFDTLVRSDGITEEKLFVCPDKSEKNYVLVNRMMSKFYPIVNSFRIVVLLTAVIVLCVILYKKVKRIRELEQKFNKTNPQL